MAYDAFISYSRRNERWVTRLAEDLRSHAVDIFQDTVEIEVGDTHRLKIEDAIQRSRYFCLVITQASMKSYYVRQIELEAAFSKMIGERRGAFILPLMRERPREPLPLMLQRFHYLDFTRSQGYEASLRRLVARLKLGDEKFTGEKFYKNLDVSPRGTFVGVEPLADISYSGFCVRIRFEEGTAVEMDMYVDGRLDCSKTISHRNERVDRIEKFRDGQRVERLIYFYDGDGLRSRKQAYGAGDFPSLEITYDQWGRRTSEAFFDEQGAPDSTSGYVRREFSYQPTGSRLEARFGADGRLIDTVSAPAPTSLGSPGR